jgi:branched-chain amino acid transport system permease protein
VGLNVRVLGVVAFTVSAALSALGGVLLIPVLPLSYDSDVAVAVNGFAAAAFGGLVSIRGAFVGGLVLGIAANLVRGYIDPQYELAIALVVMLVLIGWRSRHEALTA